MAREMKVGPLSSLAGMMPAGVIQEARETTKTFLIDCPSCKAKVAAIECGRAESKGLIPECGEPFAMMVQIGKCPICKSVLAGESHQVAFVGFDSDEESWSDIERVFPKPPKTFHSDRIPKSVRASVADADKSLQANANIAACAMFGRALEGVCRGLLEQPASTAPSGTARSARKIMLGEGIRLLKNKGIIDQRLFDWSQQLHAFRNLAAHPTDEDVSREDADDLQSFVYGITEYVYDLTDRYNDFKERIDKKAKKKAGGPHKLSGPKRVLPS